MTAAVTDDFDIDFIDYVSVCHTMLLRTLTLYSKFIFIPIVRLKSAERDICKEDFFHE